MVPRGLASVWLLWFVGIALSFGCAEGPLGARGPDGPRLMTPARDGGPVPTPDADQPDSGADSAVPDASGPTIPANPACGDDLTGQGVAVGPAGLMIQVPTVTDICQMQRALDHVCKVHQDDIHDLVLTSVERWDGAEVLTELNLEVLEAIAPYLDCFDNVFVGTVSEVLLTDPYSAATINDPDARWRWLGAAKRVAELISAWMETHTSRAWHWYVSYEANLNAFTDTSYRNAYIALLQQHIADVTALNDGVIAWSPTFWTAPLELNATARASLESALREVFDRVPVDWILIQDHLGVQPQWACSDALSYYDMIRTAAPNAASVQLNVEYFTLAGGSIRAGSATELTARVDCYKAAGASVGASFELRYWYGSHGH